MIENKKRICSGLFIMIMGFSSFQGSIAAEANSIQTHKLQKEEKQHQPHTDNYKLKTYIKKALMGLGATVTFAGFLYGSYHFLLHLLTPRIVQEAEEQQTSKTIDDGVIENLTNKDLSLNKYEENNTSNSMHDLSLLLKNSLNVTKDKIKKVQEYTLCKVPKFKDKMVLALESLKMLKDAFLESLEKNQNKQKKSQTKQKITERKDAFVRFLQNSYDGFKHMCAETIKLVNLPSSVSLPTLSTSKDFPSKEECQQALSRFGTDIKNKITDVLPVCDDIKEIQVPTKQEILEIAYEAKGILNKVKAFLSDFVHSSGKEKRGWFKKKHEEAVQRRRHKKRLASNKT